jgi:hypothetical protein
MVALGANTHTLLDGEVKVYKRGNSKRWQATFKIDQHWVSSIQAIVVPVYLRN